MVVPLHKNDDPLDKKNYRPVSILPTIYKVYEMVLSDQLTDLFENIFNPDKFQAIAVGNKTHAKTPVFKIESAEITCDEVVKLLGIDIDYQLV